jgi:rhomboid family GlyGly-CTERM serine protease
MADVTRDPRGSRWFRARRRGGPLLVPAVLAGLAGLAEIAGDAGRLALRYDRAAIAEGEVWRLITGHLVHLGPSHLAMNLLALAILAFVLPALSAPRDWLTAFVASALVIAAGLYGFHPSVAWYVGLSGVLHGFWIAGVILAIDQRRYEAVPLGLLLLFKLGYEVFFGAIPLSGEVAAGPVVTAAHAWGAVGGAIPALASIAVRRRRRSL